VKKVFLTDGMQAALLCSANPSVIKVLLLVKSVLKLVRKIRTGDAVSKGKRFECKVKRR